MSSPTIAAAASVPLLDRWRVGARALAADFRLDAGLITIFVASRIIVIGAALVAEYFIPRNPALDPGADGPILRSLTTWDGWWYLGIAANGYHADPAVGAYSNVAFPPLYPAIVKLLSLPIPGYAGVVGVLVSNVAFLLALGLFVRLGTPYIGRRRASLSAGLLVIYPFASVFAMAYSESLFLLLMFATFLATERRHRAWAGILLALTVLSRTQGVVLVLPLAILMLRQDGWRPTASMFWLALGPLAAAAFMVYITGMTGSTTAFLDATQAWGRTGIGSYGSGHTIATSFTPYLGALLVTLLATTFLFVFIRVDRIPIEYALLPILPIVADLLSGSIESVGRHTMAGFPVLWILANRRSVAMRRGWPMVSVGLFAIVAVLSFGGYWVP
ncbi:MAG TPA: mannosyltransferase family protein [Candidatus Limnocylindrales bacterium]|nr:mannosyltransferase family protein [Candidatus Limnocylindrales bacterium]